MATLGDAIALSKHDISTKVSSKLPYLQASCSRETKGEFVTIGVTGEGISIIDLTSFQPEAAALLGPEVVFAASPASRTATSTEATSARYTYAINQTSSSSSKPCDLSLWTSRESLTALEKQGSIRINDAVHALYAPEYMTDSVILVSTEGTVICCDSALQNARRMDLNKVAGELRLASIDDCSLCTFLPSQRQLHGARTALVTLLFQSHDTLILRLLQLRTAVELDEQVAIPFPDSNILRASFDKDGCLALLDDKENLHSYMINYRHGKLSATPLDSLALRSIYTPSASILCLGSSHVLLVGVNQKKRDEMAVLLWDVQYSVLLAEQLLSIPSNLSGVPVEKLQLQLLRGNQTHTILIVSPSWTQLRPSQLPAGAKSNILMIPYTVPPASTLSNVIGRAEAGNAWLKSSEDAKHSLTMDYDEGKDAILQAVVKELDEGKVDAADTIFFQWVTEETISVKESARKEAKRQLAVALGKLKEGEAWTEDIEIDKEEIKKKKIRIKHIPDTLDLEYGFISRLLSAVFNPNKDQAYSPKIVEYLLKRKLVNDNSVGGGLLNALRERKDWDNIFVLVQNSLDIAEDSLVALLVDVVRLHRSATKNAMEVDTGTPNSPKGPKIRPLLSNIITYPTSAPAMRIALRRHLTNIEDVFSILQNCRDFLKHGVRYAAGLSLGQEGSHKQKGSTPKVEKTISFLSTLLDAKLLDILQYSPAHQVLRQIQTIIEVEISLVSSLEKLRGPLEPFVATEKRRFKHAQAGDASRHHRSKEKPQDTHALAVNLYQIEEFVI